MSGGNRTAAMGAARRARRDLAAGWGALAAACALLLALAGPAGAGITFEKAFGGAGAGAGQFSGPGGIAVSEFNGHVYVADPGQHRVQEFDADGDFVRMWGQNVNQTTGGDVCEAGTGHTCKAGAIGGVGGAFNRPLGIGVDDSTGHVYVQDAGNNRVQKFTATGEFVLTWGKEVNATTDANLCTAASGNTCRPGGLSGDPNTTPPTPTANGEFRGWEQAGGAGLAVDDAGFVYVTDPRAVPNARVQKFDSNGGFVSQIAAPNQNFFDRGLAFPNGLAVDGEGNTYVIDESTVKRFEPDDYSASGLSAAYDRTYGEVGSVFGGVRQVAVDPHNGFIVIGEDDAEVGCQTGAPGGYMVAEYHPSGQQVDCTLVSPGLANTQNEAGMAVSEAHKLYAGHRPGNSVRVYATPVEELPQIGSQTTSEITSRTATLNTTIAANLDDTTYRVEYGPQPCSSNPCESTPESSSIGAALAPATIRHRLEGLTPDTKYFYRFVATNKVGTVEGPDGVFATFASPQVDNTCQNNLARQQTGAAFLLDCRAYELVSAEDAGGYNVESDLVPGQDPFAGYPRADGRVLYGVHNGGIPNTGRPTNRGIDPYLATRNAAEERWQTTYVGIPADVPSAKPFSATVASAAAGLDTFAFGGPDICDPCFDDETAGLPVRTPDGELIQGMAGSIPVPDPQPAGEVRKSLSGDGSHLVFGSYQQFEPQGNDSGTDLTIYARNLRDGGTRVVSTTPAGSAIAAGDAVAALDVSHDGSRVLIGERVDTDAEGHDLWHLYMHLGQSPGSIDLTPGTTSGVRYAGMTDDGSTVYFATADPLQGDGDSSVDLYAAEVSAGGADLTRVSAGVGGTGNTDACDPAGNSYNPEDWNVQRGGPTDCSAVAIGGGGGVAIGGGGVYFLSPERLAGPGNGTEGAPNLYLGRPGAPPAYVATLESSANEPLGPASHVFDRAFGSFVNPEGAAIDPVTGASYIWDPALTEQTPGAYVQKFDSAGKVDTSFADGGKLEGKSGSEPFLALGNGPALGFPIGIPNGIAVDAAPSSPNYRDLWVPDLLGGLLRFSPSGEYEASIPMVFPMAIAVNPGNGNVTAMDVFGAVKTFTPAGTEVGPPLTGPNFAPGDLAVDSAGNTYIVEAGVTKKYDSTGAFVETLDSNSLYGVAVDPADDHVYVNRGDRVVEYDEEGNQVGDAIGVGTISGSVDLAAHGGRLIVANGGDDNALEFTEPITPPARAYDSPLVLGSVRDPEARRSGEFQTTPDGDVAVFRSVLPLTDFDNAGRYEIFRYDAAADSIECVSCNPTLATPSTDARLASKGLSVSDDGRVFFTSGEPLVLRDDNLRLDVYEWSAGKIELISTGKDRFDSGLLSASADGTDVFFFTRETLAVNDKNGTLMKIYDAREEGGFFVIPPRPECAASDECHGPGSQAAPPTKLGTLRGQGRNVDDGAAACDPKPLQRRAKRLSRQAARWRGKARRAPAPRAKKLRRKARRAARGAKRARNGARRCLRRAGGER